MVCPATEACPAETGAADTTTSGQLPSGDDWVMLHEHGECSSTDWFLGYVNTVDECANLCQQYEHCRYFSYGVGNWGSSDHKKCYVEFTHSDDCDGNQWIDTPSYDF